jgi:hypothetical protein
MTDGPNIIRPNFYKPPSVPKKSTDNGIVPLYDPKTGKVAGKRINQTGLIRLVAMLIEKKCDGLITFAAKDIEDLECRDIYWSYNPTMDIFDAAVVMHGQPNPFAVSEGEEEHERETDEREPGQDPDRN